MRTEIYKCDLRGVNVTEYNRNPVVLHYHDHTKIVGKGKVLKGKTTVEVQFDTDLNVYDKKFWTVGAGLIVAHEKELIELSMIPLERID